MKTMTSEALKQRHQAQRDYLLQHPDNWLKSNPAKWRTIQSKSHAKKRALKRGVAVGDLTKIAKIYARCEWWRQWFDVLVDHIIPLGRGGSHEASNLQIIYRRDNEKKHLKLDYKPQVIFL